MKLAKLILTMTFLTLAFQNCGEVSLVPAGEKKAEVTPTPSPTPPIDPTPSPTPEPSSTATAISVLKVTKAGTLQTQIIGYDLSKTADNKKIFEFSISNSNSYHNTVKDINGDGTEDFYILNVQIPQYTLNFYSGKTGQLLSSNLYSIDEIGTIFYVGHFDQDNEIDLLTIKAIDKTISIYDLNKNLKRRHTFTFLDNTVATVVGDVNKDGVKDIHINLRSDASILPIQIKDTLLSGSNLSVLWSHEKAYSTTRFNDLLFIPNKDWLIFTEQDMKASIIDTNNMNVIDSITAPHILTTGSNLTSFYSHYKRNIALDESIFLSYCETITLCFLAELRAGTSTISSAYIQTLLDRFQININSARSFSHQDFFKSNNDTHLSAFINLPNYNARYIVYNHDKQIPVLDTFLENVLLYTAIILKQK